MNESQKTILVVDDEPSICEVLSEVLEVSGFKTMTANGGRKAFALLTNQSTDLVVSDIRMPQGDGVELLEEIKRKGSIKPPIFLISGYSEFSPMDLYDRGADAVLSKPIILKDLLKIIHKALKEPEEAWSSTEIAKTQHEIELSTNISLGRGGFFLPLKDEAVLEIPVNTPIGFKITTENDQYPQLDGQGIIRWVRKTADTKNPSGLGIEFSYLTDATRRQIIKAIQEMKLKPFIPQF